MGKNQQLELPESPQYQENANLSPNITFGSDYFKQLLSGDFTGNLSWLSPLTNTNTSANALSYAQGILQPQFAQNLLDIKNEAAANGQLESSTFSDALAKSQSNLNSQYQAIVSQGAINDAYQNNANALNLLGIGNQGLQGFTGLAQNQTNAKNAFNLENYSNLVANAIQNNKNANSATGWQQAIGLLSPIGNDYLKSQGVNNVPGYGVADMASIAGSFFGMGGGGFGGGGGLSGAFQSGGSAPSAGAYASNFGNGLYGGYQGFYNGLQNPFIN